MMLGLQQRLTGGDAIHDLKWQPIRNVNSTASPPEGTPPGQGNVEGVKGAHLQYLPTLQGSEQPSRLVLLSGVA